MEEFRLELQKEDGAYHDAAVKAIGILREMSDADKAREAYYSEPTSGLWVSKQRRECTC